MDSWKGKEQMPSALFPFSILKIELLAKTYNQKLSTKVVVTKYNTINKKVRKSCLRNLM